MRDLTGAAVVAARVDGGGGVPADDGPGVAPVPGPARTVRQHRSHRGGGAAAGPVMTYVGSPHRRAGAVPVRGCRRTGRRSGRRPPAGRRRSRRDPPWRRPGAHSRGPVHRRSAGPARSPRTGRSPRGPIPTRRWSHPRSGSPCREGRQAARPRPTAGTGRESHRLAAWTLQIHIEPAAADMQPRSLTVCVPPPGGMRVGSVNHGTRRRGGGRRPGRAEGTHRARRFVAEQPGVPLAPLLEAIKSGPCHSARLPVPGNIRGRRGSEPVPQRSSAPDVRSTACPR
ncbi:hypothetical protein SAMN05660359_03706 [Geodermatophilus obscurus]|uniref:Uncharacterized protein n=1 Tax=Geodermatophilus obscurus TaxID=1861 RepID=A0A1I5HGN5_9ACTN|nr:hypothetical protein SAMN05660359_03706 [Geodermatophilus obscurus]